MLMSQHEGIAEAEGSKRSTNALHDYIRTKLAENGQREALQNKLKEDLKESGWCDDLKEQCKEVMRSRARKSSTDLNVEALTKELIKNAQSTVPVRVKTDYMAKLKEVVLKDVDLTEYNA